MITVKLILVWTTFASLWDRLRNWHRCSLGDKLAGQGLGSWTCPRAGFLEDVLIESSERVAEFCLNSSGGMASSSLRIDASS
jgi:hypothetical protein